MVSVVVPIYNVREYLSRCIDTLYNQQGIDIEVILVNDGSTDNSLKICEEYAKKSENTIIIDKDNGGLSDARNAGTEVATGDYIYFLDSDDWLAPNALSTLCDFAVKNDCEIVQGGFYYAYDDYLLYDRSRMVSQILSRKEALLELIKNDYVKNFAWGKLYRADIVKKHRFPKGKFYEDSYWQHLIVHECTRYGIVPTPLYYYRQRSSGISGSFSLKNLDLLRGYEERLSFVQANYPIYTKDMISMLWHLAYYMVKLADVSGEEVTREGYRNYWHSLNLRYEELFRVAMRTDVKYHIWKICPSILPILDFGKRVLDRCKPSKRYQKIWLKM